MLIFQNLNTKKIENQNSKTQTLRKLKFSNYNNKFCNIDAFLNSIITITCHVLYGKFNEGCKLVILSISNIVKKNKIRTKFENSNLLKRVRLRSFHRYNVNLQRAIQVKW